ncbi:MAG: hypothetical protein CGW95_10650 [Phenylobacterium zucineum]|nr:MAG: hypothetical protein CGW95_10650 [Phenylobacterium zucineum]
MPGRKTSVSSVRLHGFAPVELSLTQVCDGAVIAWDTKRFALAVINMSAIAGANGVIGARDSALDIADWLAFGVGHEVTLLAGGTLQRRRLAALIWPWLSFESVDEPGGRGSAFEITWSSIQAVWITADGLTECLAG